MTPLPDAAVAHLVARQSLEYQNAHLYEDHTKDLGAYIIVLIVLAVGAMVMRVWCRLHTGIALAREDYTYLLGSTIAIGSFIVMLLYAFVAGLGKHWVALTPDQRALFPKLNYAYNILNVLAYPIIKISILLFYIRIFSVLSHFTRIIWIAILIIAASGVANTLISIFSCTPIRAFWDPSTPGTCINDVAFYYWTAVFNCITDLFILVAPMPVIWRRDLTHKVAVTALFMLGGLTFVVSILRIVYYLEYSADDPSYSFLDSGYATPGEVCLAVIVASAPTWKPVWRFFITRLQSLYYGYRNRSRGMHSLTSVGTTPRNVSDAEQGMSQRGRKVQREEKDGEVTQVERLEEVEIGAARSEVSDEKGDDGTISGRAGKEGDSEISLTRASTGRD